MTNVQLGFRTPALSYLVAVISVGMPPFPRIHRVAMHQPLDVDGMRGQAVGISYSLGALLGNLGGRCNVQHGLAALLTQEKWNRELLVTISYR